MAIDLASRSSSKMFSYLLSVASETFEKLELAPSSEKSPVINSKRHIKKSSAPFVMTFEDVRALPIKSLIEKFSEMTSDELTKKYAYKCLLLPHVCTTTYKSFGNEKKAHDKIKSHLLLHIEQLTSEYETKKEEFGIVFSPKSPTSVSKSTDKLTKKCVKKQILQNHSPLLDSHRSPKKVKSSPLRMKKVREKVHCMSNKSISEFKKCYSKDKTQDSVYSKDKSQIISHENLAYQPRKEIVLSETAEFKIPNKNSFFYGNKRHTAYCSCLNCTFPSDTCIKEEIDEEPISEELSNYDRDSYEEMETSSDLTSTTTNDKTSVHLHDHNYVTSGETKSDKLFSQDGKLIMQEYVELPLDNENNIPWCVIRTPPFPYVHTPVMFYVSEIQEVGIEEVHQYGKRGFSTPVKLSQQNKFKCEEEFQNDELIHDHEDKYTSVYCKMNCGSATVLECVENRVSIKPSNTCVPKSEISVTENDENSENMQRVEKELALKYIAKLHAKKKKRIPDSLFCQICPGKHFTAQATLIHHYRSHAGIKPYACKICSSTFTRQHSLNYHMLIHQNRSRFTCDFCGRTFRHPSHYKEHLRRHTGETPYHCTDCNLHFKTRNTFKRHLKTRHGKLLTAAGIETMSNDQFTKYIPKNKLGKQ